MLKIHYTRFPVTSSCQGSCGLVAAWRANKSATSWQQVVVMEFGKRHDTTDTTDVCTRLVTDLSFMLRTCYGEIGVMILTLNQLRTIQRAATFFPCYYIPSNLQYIVNEYCGILSGGVLSGLHIIAVYYITLHYVTFIHESRLVYAKYNIKWSTIAYCNSRIKTGQNYSLCIVTFCYNFIVVSYLSSIKRSKVVLVVQSFGVRRTSNGRWFDSRPGHYRQLGQLSLQSLRGR